MPRSAGTVRLTFEAGTAGFVADVNKAKATVREFGTQTKSTFNARYAFFALKDIAEGRTKFALAEVANEVSRFRGALLGLSVGTLALAGVGVAAYEVSQQLKEMAAMPGKIASAFRAVNNPLRDTNDQLAVTNARLENDIAKLEGRRENTLKVALLEAVAEADKLSDALERDLGGLNKLLGEQHVSFLHQLMGNAGTDDIKKQLGGETGHEGFIGRIEAANDAGIAGLAAAKTKEQKDAAQAAWNAGLLKEYAAELKIVNGEISKSKTIQQQIAEYRKPENFGLRESYRKAGRAIPVDQMARVADLAGVGRNLQKQMDRIALDAANQKLQEQKSGLEGAAANAKLGKPFADRMKAIDAEMEGLRAKLEAVGQPEAAKGILLGFGEARKAIEEVNKQLEAINPTLRLTGAQMGSISKYYVVDKPKLELLTQWKTKLDAAKESLEQSVAAERMLSDAIGRGFAAQRRAAIETQVLGKVGLQAYGDPTKAGDVAKLRAQVTADYDAKRAGTSAQAVHTLRQEIQAQNLLTQAQRLGEEEIRRLGAWEIWRAGTEKGETRQQIALEVELYYAKLRTEQAAGVAKIQAETSATKKLTAAQLQGAEAARKEGLENKYVGMQRAGLGATVPAERLADEAMHQLDINKQVAARINVYSDEMEKLDQERDRLLEIIGAHKATADQARALRDLQQERLALWAREQLAIGTARSGLRAFFAEMEADSKRIGNVIYDTLTSAVDRVSDELAKLMTGQKTSFGKMLQGLGEEALKGTIKQGMEKGLGAVGKALGIKMPEGKPDFTAAKPGHVIVDNLGGSSPIGGYSPIPASMRGAASGGSSAIGGLLKAAGGGLAALLGGLFGGGGGGGESVTSNISYKAAGGPLSPSEAYIVGEQGPELLTRTAGHITSNAELRRTMGGGGHTFQTTVYAPGADLGAANRISRALEATRQASVRSAQAAVAEHRKRTVQRS